MRIALCHPARIPPHKYGGTERIVAWLAEALVHLGHTVTLVSGEGSEVKGTQWIQWPADGDWEAIVRDQVDLAHLWATPHRAPRIPYLVTIEGNGRPGESFLPNTVFISRRHAENHGATHWVYNGLDPAPYRWQEPKSEDTLVFLAKASWAVKNLPGAIAVARAAGMRLEVMGSRDWPFALHRWIPTVRGVHYRGMVDDIEKRDVLARARALLFPVRWDEPFGIAITEALASGCAVYGTPYGSLPEIVSPEVGMLSTSGADLVAALREGPRPSPADCRSRVEQVFSAEKMAREYAKLYEKVLTTGTLGTQTSLPIQTRPGFDAQKLLDWQMP